MGALIVVRGNSGSGKSTLARTLRMQLAGVRTELPAAGAELPAVWIEQDYFRRVVLGESGNYSALSVELIEQSASLALAAGRTVILDGIFNAARYSATFRRLRTCHDGPDLFYAYDLSLDETLHRHGSRPHKAAEFGAEQMRGWYRGWDPLEGIEEERIGAAETLQQTAARVLADLKRAAGAS